MHIRIMLSDEAESKTNASRVELKAFQLNLQIIKVNIRRRALTWHQLRRASVTLTICVCVCVCVCLSRGKLSFPFAFVRTQSMDFPV